MHWLSMKSSGRSCKIICTKKINFREDSGVIKEKAIETLEKTIKKDGPKSVSGLRLWWAIEELNF